MTRVVLLYVSLYDNVNFVNRVGMYLVIAPYLDF